MASSIDEYIGVSEVHKPVMPATQPYEATGYDVQGRQIKLSVWATSKLEAEQAIARMAKEVWPGSTIGVVKCS